MKLDGATVTAVQLLITNARAARRAAELAAGYLVGSVEQQDKYWTGLNLRERYLGGRFGGNRGKLTVYRAARAQVKIGQATADALSLEATACDERVTQALRAALLELGPYQTLEHTVDQATATLAAVYDFSQIVAGAVDGIRHAQSMNTLDAVSNNPGLSLMDYSATSSAKEAIDLVAQNADTFRRAVSAYQQFVDQHLVAATLDPTINMVDLVLDLALCDLDFDGDFDFSFGWLDFLQMAELNNAEAAMVNASRQVGRVHGIIAHHREALLQQQAVFMDDARRQCV